GRLREEVPRTKSGLEGELALGSLEVRHDLGLPRRIALERERLTFELQLVAQRRERRFGPVQLVEHAALRLVVEGSEDRGEIEFVRADRLRDLHSVFPLGVESARELLDSALCVRQLRRAASVQLLTALPEARQLLEADVASFEPL